jgi:hypothetical protein
MPDFCVWLLLVRMTGAHRPAPQVLAEDFQYARSSMLVLLKLKTAHLDKLPWLFCGLAHTDEGVSRGIGSRIVDSWRQDPRELVHHRLTWELMRPGSAFLESLLAYVGGMTFAAMPVAFQIQVAEFRFVPIVETSIEAKHAKTSLAKKAHHIGPVRLSLANRLPFLDRSMRAGHIDPRQLLEMFHKARSIGDVAGVWDIRISSNIFTCLVSNDMLPTHASRRAFRALMLYLYNQRRLR